MRVGWGQFVKDSLRNRKSTSARRAPIAGQSGSFALWTLANPSSGWAGEPSGWGRAESLRRNYPGRNGRRSFLGTWAGASSSRASLTENRPPGATTLAHQGGFQPRHAFGGYLGSSAVYDRPRW